MCVATSSILPLVLQKRVAWYSMIRVGLAEDHPEMRVVLRLLLRISQEIEIVCEVSDGTESVDCVKRLQPDVLVMDIRMPGLNGYEATRQITDLSLPTRVILMSSYRGSSIISQAVAAGAKGFVPKDELATSLRLAIEAVYRGEEFFVE